MQVFRILFGSLARYVRADNRAHAHAIAVNAWTRAAQSISAVEAIGNYAPASLGAAGYDNAINCEDRELSRAKRAERKAQRKAYRAQQAAQRPAVNVGAVFATL